jgi:hypothetical protein
MSKAWPLSKKAKLEHTHSEALEHYS